MEFELSQEEHIAAELEDEREQTLKIQLRQDERSRQQSLEPEAPPKKKKLKRELRREALTRLEEAARTQKDFDEVVAWWDKLDENRERRERDHEVLRGDVPLEYGAVQEGTIFPASLCSPFWRELCSGYFLNIIFICPYEMHELLADDFLSKMIFELKEDHKELFYYKVLRRYSSAEVGAVLSQTDRNIRKKWTRLLIRLQKKLFEHITEKSSSGQPLMLREKTFLEEYKKSVLDDGKNGW
jgi:hypothetical protein